MEQGAGEGEEVLDFGAGFEGFDVDGAVGDGGAVGEVVAAKNEMRGFFPFTAFRVRMTALDEVVVRVTAFEF